MLGVCKQSAWGDAPSYDIEGFQPYRFLIRKADLYTCLYTLYSVIPLI